VFAAWRSTAIAIEAVQLIRFQIPIDTFSAGTRGTSTWGGLDHYERGLVLLRNLRRRQPSLLQRGILAEQRFLQRPSHTISLQSVKIRPGPFSTA
jgi:hypothetical protein